MGPLLAALRAQLAAFARGRTHRIVLATFLAVSLLTAGALRGGALRELPLAVVDLDGTGPSRAVTRLLDATPELRLVDDGPASLEDAQAALARGDLAAVVVLPDGLSAAMKRGRRAEVVLAVDMGNLLAGKAAQKAAQRVIATAAAGAQVAFLEKLGVPAAAAPGRALPMTVTEALSRNPGASAAVYLVPTYAWFYLNVLVVLLAWATLWPSRLGTVRGRAGALAAAWGVAFGAGLVTAYVIVPLGGLGMPTAFPVLAAVLGLFLLADVLLVRAFAALFQGSLLGFQVTVLLTMMSLMLSGLTWPGDALPAPLRALAAAHPFVPFASAIRRFQHEPASLADLARPLGALALQALAYAAVTAAAEGARHLAGRRARLAGRPA